MGENFFRTNETEKAIPCLQKSIEENENPKAYIYLAMCYFQQEKYSQALVICNKGMEVSGTDKKVLAFDAGNIAFAMNDYAGAEKWYSRSMEEDPFYAAPVLNRANTRLKTGRLQESKADYEKYIVMNPDSPQGNSIYAIISMIDEQLENEKKADAIKVEQEKKKNEDIRRVDADRSRQEAEASKRRKKMLEDVVSSLQDSSSENLEGASGTEMILDGSDIGSDISDMGVEE
ncbi:MAG: hypothetical protein K6G00_03215 [Treponema sp.]|nr:hypothetical protein [Treponema sp.]